MSANPSRAKECSSEFNIVNISIVGAPSKIKDALVHQGFVHTTRYAP